MQTLACEIKLPSFFIHHRVVMSWDSELLSFRNYPVDFFFSFQKLFFALKAWVFFYLFCLFNFITNCYINKTRKSHTCGDIQQMMMEKLWYLHILTPLLLLIHLLWYARTMENAFAWATWRMIKKEWKERRKKSCCINSSCEN